MVDTVIIYKGTGVVPEAIILSGLAIDAVRGDGTCSPPTGIVESSGPTTLSVGSVTDGQYLKRVGVTLVGATIAGGGDMLKTENLSGLESYITARVNLGLGTAAVTNSGAYATAAQGTLADSALQSIANGSITLAKQADVATATVFYRKTAGAGAPEVNTLATLKTDLALVKADVGLGSVDNTTDANKPVSTAGQTALNLKANLAGPTFTGTVGGVTKAMVGLTSVDDTSDAGKPVSTAQQTALNLKANLASPTFTGTVGGVTAAMVGLGSANNTSDAGKPVSTAQQTALDLKANLASPTFTGVVGLPSFQTLVSPAIGAATGTSLSVTGTLVSTGTAGIGYGGGAGGTVVQATTKATGVTLNKTCGTITMNAAALAAATIVSFIVTNSTMAATDVVHIQHDTVGAIGGYTVMPNTSAAGSFRVSVRNNTAGSLSEAIVLRFVVIKAVVA